MRLLFPVFIAYHLAPQAFRAPNSTPQAFQLHDLAVIYKEVYVCAVIFDVPREHARISASNISFCVPS